MLSGQKLLTRDEPVEAQGSITKWLNRLTRPC